jgi:hypothetical protein
VFGFVGHTNVQRGKWNKVAKMKKTKAMREEYARHSSKYQLLQAERRNPLTAWPKGYSA